jgi:gliding motility-associated protein GldC
MSKSSEIKFTVHLDVNHVPEKIEWFAEDGGAASTCKSVMISIWDEQEKNTLRMDVWNKEMSTDEMKHFFHQSLMTMADTFERATGETEMSQEMRDFSIYFADRMKLIATES